MGMNTATTGVRVEADCNRDKTKVVDGGAESIGKMKENSRKSSVRNGDTKHAGAQRTSETTETTTTISRVTFSTIEIRDYPIIPGVNPAVSKGVPLTIDWHPLEEGVCYSIHDYETQRPSRNRRSLRELRRLPSDRTLLLRGLGVSRDEIQQATKAANIGRHKRTRTKETIQLAPAQEACEKLARAMKNATVGRTKKRLERTLLEAYISPLASRTTKTNGMKPAQHQQDDDDDDTSCYSLTTSSRSETSYRLLA